MNLFRVQLRSALVIACISIQGSTALLSQTPKSSADNNAGEISDAVAAANGLWKIDQSHSEYGFGETWHRNDPPWKFLLLVDGTVATFRKSGEPFYWITTTQVTECRDQAGTLNCKTRDLDGVEGTCTLRLTDNKMKFSNRWIDVKESPINGLPMKSRSRLELTRLNARATRDLLPRILKDAHYLRVDRETRERIDAWSRSLQNATSGTD